MKVKEKVASFFTRGVKINFKKNLLNSNLSSKVSARQKGLKFANNPTHFNIQENHHIHYTIGLFKNYH
jgi:hypothetical protein